jgi:hypothetical protein
MSDIRELKYLWNVPIYSIYSILLSDNKWYPTNHPSGGGLIVYGHFGDKPQYFELRYWGDKEGGSGIVIQGLTSQIKLLKTDWS